MLSFLANITQHRGYMKLHLKFHCFVIAICMLICIAPLTTFAQQQIQTDNSKAIADARADAKSDISPLTWVGVGVCVPLVSIATGCITAITLRDEESSSGEYLDIGLGSDSVIGFFGGVGIILYGASYWVYTFDKPPPVERLIGKSPEYIEHYTKAYQKAMRSLRIKYALVGVGGSALVPVIIGRLWSI